MSEHRSEERARSEHRVPAYMTRIVEGVGGDATREHMARWAPPEEGGRASAVLILIADGPHGPDVLLIERAAALRNHAGQAAFPGGGTDPGDAGPAATALREASEEVGLDPSGVSVVAILEPLFLKPSGYIVTPVLAYWHAPAPVRVLDTAEVAAVDRIPLAELADPANRFCVSHPSGYTGAAFAVGRQVVWGFTAGLLDMLLELGGWARPWDETDIRDVETAVGSQAKLS